MKQVVNILASRLGPSPSSVHVKILVITPRTSKVFQCVPTPAVIKHFCIVLKPMCDLASSSTMLGLAVLQNQTYSLLVTMQVTWVFPKTSDDVTLRPLISEVTWSFKDGNRNSRQCLSGVY